MLEVGEGHSIHWQQSGNLSGKPVVLIARAATLADIATVIVQGRYDMLTPAVTAVDLHQALPSADLVIVDDAGHAFDGAGIVDALVRITHRFADPQ